MQPTHSALRAFIEELPLGHPVATQSFQRFGNRDAVDKALSRLVREGAIKRVVRGVYVRPEVSPILGELSVPLEDVAAALAEAEGARVQVSGEAALNLLRLSTQVPAQAVLAKRTQMIGWMRRIVEILPVTDASLPETR